MSRVSLFGHVLDDVMDVIRVATSRVQSPVVIISVPDPSALTGGDLEKELDEATHAAGVSGCVIILFQPREVKDKTNE